MDATTAALAFIIAQSCIALVMVGAHLAARPEPATAYWALSAIMVLAGVLMVVASHWFPVLRPIGSSGLVFGTVLQLWGLQAFYKARRGAMGWVIGSVARLLFILLVMADAPVYQHLIVLASALLILLAASLRVLLAGVRPRWTFASVLTLGAIVLLMSNNIIRIMQAIEQDPGLLVIRSPMGIVTLYLIPLGGIFLYATGLLLYFERLIDDKNNLATHDDLTGLLNRRAILAMGEREVAMAIRHKRPLTVAFVNIDFFKRVNDSHGHEAGDLVPAATAQRTWAKDCCRRCSSIASKTSHRSR